MNKTILLTGGTGSFGNAFIRRFINSDIKKIIVFSRDEDKQDLMRHEYKSPKLKFVLGNVTEYNHINNVMQGVDVVFHAAALKQVPSCEFAPLEASKTNIFGTDNVLTVAIAHNVKHIICLSTGKAVYPINAMGLSKALMEKVIVNKARELIETENTTSVLKYIRFSNVFATRGSAINIFTKQIKKKQSVTVTHPDMIRSIMTIDEAVDLALFAMQNGENGDLFVYKARRTTLKQLVEYLFDVYEAENREIQVIGARHGEKMEETILSIDERMRAVDMDDFVRIPMDRRGLNYMNTYKGKNRRGMAKKTKPLEVQVKHLTLDYIQKILQNRENKVVC